MQPDVRIEVECGGSDRGIKDIREGNAEIGMVSRASKADEKGLFGFPMARDGVSIIVHKTNPLTALSNEQITGIFSGKIGTWLPLNGKDAPIAVILREPQKPVTEMFEKHFGLHGRLRGRSCPGTIPSPLRPSPPIPMRSGTFPRGRRSATRTPAPRYASFPWAA